MIAGYANIITSGGNGNQGQNGANGRKGADSMHKVHGVNHDLSDDSYFLKVVTPRIESSHHQAYISVVISPPTLMVSDFYCLRL